jgi:ribonuclease R
VIIDGGQFDSEIFVGDAGAKGCSVGEKVVIEMVRFPGVQRNGRFRSGEAVIVKVLGERGQPGVDTLTIIAEFGLPGEFSERVLDDARRQAEVFDESVAGRTDFTDQTVITIDPRTARDFDDAISLKRIRRGHWQLGVHIADVSHFVRPNTELDNEACRRGTSIYLPDRVIPMLPEIISNNLASLQPDRLRYCLTALIEFTDDGVPVATELHRGAIRSCHRFNYEEIDEYLADDRPWKKKLAPDVFRLVRDMHGLAMKLRKRRMDRGSFDLAIPEVEIQLDEDGRVSGATTRKHTESHQIIEEFMLTANEAVAQHLVDQGLYLLRRVHENPSPAKLADLKTMLSALGYEADNLTSRFELKRIIEASRDTPESHAVHYAILRALPKAIYSPRELGHYALASQAYCHFTSPIRRYPDLVIHRMLAALIEGHKPAADFGTLLGLGQHCSELEQRAEKAERELVKLKLINFLKDRIGEEMDAVISGVESFGLFAEGVSLPAGGFIPLDSLPRDRYQFDRGSRTLTGFRSGNRFRLGDRVRIRVVSADPDRREVEFALVSGKPRQATASLPQQKRDQAKNGSAGKRGPSSRSDKAPRKHR